MAGLIGLGVFFGLLFLNVRLGFGEWDTLFPESLLYFSPSRYSIDLFLIFTVFLIGYRFARSLWFTHMIGSVCLVVLLALTFSSVPTEFVGLSSSSGILGVPDIKVSDQVYFLVVCFNACLLLRFAYSRLPPISPYKVAFLASFGLALILYVIISSNAALDKKLIDKDYRLILSDMKREIREQLKNTARAVRVVKRRLEASERRGTTIEIDSSDRLEQLPRTKGLFVYSASSGLSDLSGDRAAAARLSAKFPDLGSQIEAVEPLNDTRMIISKTGDPLTGLLLYPMNSFEGMPRTFLAEFHFDSYLQTLAFSRVQNERMLITINGQRIREDFELPEDQFSDWGNELSFDCLGLQFTLQIIPDPEIFIQLQEAKRRILWIAGVFAVALTWWVFLQKAKGRDMMLKTLELNALLEEEVQRRIDFESGLKQANLELERSNRDLQEFAQVASHDLQEPLRITRAFAERIDTGYRDALDAKGQDYLNRMCRAVDRMSVLIGELLNYARVHTKASPMCRVTLSVVIAEVQDLFADQLEALGGEIIIEDNMPDVEADESQLRQLFQNLLGNAIKFSREGVPPRIRIHTEVKDGKLWISVSDNGIGIEQEYVDKIFKVFQRLNTRTNYPGTGIGLAICKRIVERHGGEFVVRSTVGEGSTFSFCLSFY
tara:strand:+ start:583 stop:2562 length:1980 start_codon:yes stop_codon:yes gene_type:complete